MIINIIGKVLKENLKLIFTKLLSNFSFLSKIGGKVKNNLFWLKKQRQA
jgi:hypothetical protein